MTQIHNEQSANNLSEEFDVRQLAIMPHDRKTLHQRIEKRLQIMFKEGFIEEVKGMYERGDLHTELPSIRAVGYRQLWSYFDSEYDLAEAQFRALVATRNLAKRQMTWLRSWPELTILYTDDEQGTTLAMPDLVDQTLKNLNLNQYI